ncbi:MAG: FecR domain-containing protein, partial [Candidatus Solibacter usitatus]|nr:FecR domain-containing protein [Candidatus Solibacter usitatus]
MNRFDEIVNQVRNDEPAPEIAAEAAERVRRELFGAGAAGVAEIRGCGDFQTLIPSYLQKTISDARRMLLEDHVRECVSCRKALDAARGSTPRTVAITTRVRRPRWGAIAAALFLCAAGAVYASRYSFMHWFDSGPRATVEVAAGMIYRVTDAGILPAVEGAALADNEEIRTADGARAMLRLWDGSRVEMNERAGLSVGRSYRGTTIRLDRGHIIVQAAKQKQGKLFVSTGDGEVAVKGTIFSVNRGILGALVSVAEGEVQVTTAGKSSSLQPGQQTATSDAVAATAAAAEFAWSRDSVRYLALLGELTALQNRLERIPSPGLRYQSRLLAYAPDDAILYSAIPNLNLTLAEMRRVFDERLQSSEVLRSWWTAAENKSLRESVDFLLDKLRELSASLGEEIAMTLQGASTPYPILFAEV